MTPDQILKNLAASFYYTPDGYLDAWQIMRPSEAGRLKGDCEDFALTLAWLLAGCSWARFWWHAITFKSVIWFCRLPDGQYHAILWHRGAGWADNVRPWWVDACPWRRFFPFVLPLLALKLATGRASAWINRTL